ncbi:MAG: glycoside hydrolase family 97 catalytic domain-containing protein [Bacillota bacterium]
MDEETEFVLTGDHEAWWIPAFQKERYEYLYNKTPINSISKSFRAVHTPLTMKTADGLIHGATTENAKRYIDFAAKYGIPMVLIEGWNVGWDSDWLEHGEQFKFTVPFEDFDIQEVASTQ